MKFTKAFKVIIIEVGMLGGIVVAGYTLPDNTPLKTFAVASVAIFFLGNILLIRSLRVKSQVEGKGRSAWPHILRAFAIIAVCWLLILVLYRL